MCIFDFKEDDKLKDFNRFYQLEQLELWINDKGSKNKSKKLKLKLLNLKFLFVQFETDKMSIEVPSLHELYLDYESFKEDDNFKPLDLIKFTSVLSIKRLGINGNFKESLSIFKSIEHLKCNIDFAIRSIKFV